MDIGLSNRLNKLIGEHKINLMSPKGLLEISIATIEAVKSHLEERHPIYKQHVDHLSDSVFVLNNNR